MASAIFIIGIGMGLLLVYGAGVFVMTLHAGESPASAASQASAWWAAFSISHLFGYLAITLR
ncbi:hypothetical protein MIZ01_1721 [Sideroxyarcus emersonii]|uniref:Uncharacterized protein n=1 Tax=Sideroxyarcus emersonii TaxID=2764705 RepID=A0AAN2BZ75_9PROT|nr:hypothetical protein [Sideroxyarcus emersonii]BCK87924.1 hypothetical protein MIZ01_1721 [Sideroxyarcus emersonii]